ncbi:hypothetical protein MSG28_007231 [Choristoneura fumiferana]|uniref:Uncharacterized protein n=1 Tax=Choristoneura fumiferana TaxID=7141 RepID=A0ACC0JW10_CHOFU|nr:hypothetical protein MSG28_007231 [Choristoneura fumiferana]
MYCVLRRSHALWAPGGGWSVLQPPEVCVFINKRERYSTALGAVCITNLKEANLEALLARMEYKIPGAQGCSFVAACARLRGCSGHLVRVCARPPGGVRVALEQNMAPLQPSTFQLTITSYKTVGARALGALGYGAGLSQGTC